jgi:dienelactone hydrolase
MNHSEQEQQRIQLYNLLGDLPDRAYLVSAELIEVSEHDGYSLEKLLLSLNGIERVPAYFVKPLHVTGRVPCILYNHAHGADYVLGKDELLVGRDALQSPSYAKALTQNGYAALCIDYWCFGERRGRSESATFKEMLWRGQVLWGMMLFDSIKAVDYLTTRVDVDASRIGTLGLSMGSTAAWWLSALDTRIKVCIDLCCLTDFQALIDSNGLDEHGVYYYVPSLLKHFTTAQINALIAPRPHLALEANRDPLTPRNGLDRIDQALREVYQSFGAPSAWQLIRYDIGHFETAHMRRAVLDFLAKWL